MSPREDSYVTPTGWRVVGREPPAEFDPAPVDHPLVPGRADALLYAVVVTVTPGAAGKAAVEWVLEAIQQQLGERAAPLGVLRRDGDAELPPSRYGGFVFRHRVEAGQWSGRLRWREVHPLVPGAPITTEVTLEEQRSFTRLGVRVTADGGLASVRGAVGAGHAQPLFLRQLRPHLRFTWLGAPVAPRKVMEGEEADLVRSVLAAGTRDVPAAVLSPTEDGSYLVDPADLAFDLMGRGRLHVLKDHGQTFRLSDTVGDRRLSCFFGALRAYMPGFTVHDNPYDHPLLVADRLTDPVMRAAMLGQLGVDVGKKVRLPDVVPLEVAEEEPPPGTEVAEEDAGAAGGAAGAAALGRGEEESRAREMGDVTDGAVVTVGAIVTDGATGTAPGEERSRTVGSPSGEGRAGERSSGAAVRKTPAEEERAGGERTQGERTQGGAARGGPARAISAEGRETLLRVQADLSTLSSAVQDLAGSVRELLRSSRTLADEVERLRTLSAVRSASTSALERRMSALESLLTRFLEPDRPVEAVVEEEPEEPAEDRYTLVDAVRDAADTHADTLLLLDSAAAAAAESPYEDPERVRAILDAMARVARKRRDGELDTSLREAFAEFGIDYRGGIAKSTPERLRRQYVFSAPDGQPIECVEHIALGQTYDPRRCLRIYLSSRVPAETRFVVAHVGRHFEVVTST